MPILEIAIPTFNRSAELRSRLSELMPLLNDSTLVTVFDNCSTDDTSETVRSYLNHPKFRYSRAEYNGGFSRNILRCFEETTGDWVWVTSDDDPVKPDDLDILIQAMQSNRADIYTFKTQGNHIKRNVICHDIRELLENQELLSLAYISATLYSRKAINAGRHILTTASYTYVPHVVMILAGMARGMRIEFKMERLLVDYFGVKRVARREFALGAITCLDFMENLGLRRMAARQIRANTRWMLLSALAQTENDGDIAIWKQTCLMVNSNTYISGGGFFSCLFHKNWHSKKDWAREIEIKILLRFPVFVLKKLASQLSARTPQKKSSTLFEAKAC